MAGASADGEVNHWPAFVDVLTTVIMVVTFLLVIMSAAVMQLSQRVIQNMKAQMEAREASRITKSDHSEAKASPSGGSPGQQVNAIRSPAQAEAGTSIAELGSILRSETVVNGADRLTIRTRETKDTLAIQVKAIEQPDAAKGVEVKTADTLLKISFEPRAANIDDSNASRVAEFIRGRGTPGAKYEIWSFSPQISSVSEAQRLAFYRAAMTRNILIRAGVPPGNVYTQVRVTDPKSTDGHMVRVVLKP